ncbi:DUF4011 domain-containing protein [uncultured Paraglaciecola sp.]|uniref:DUF4011 domain-containing protein n=1 Tax=uncultured Paraglaciecola sp. TaxID=1765024 RepID=UPI0025954BDA|nr:DUF4011 domain-containing protein [uncultured Paraglaciecola sp.]
MEKFTLVADVAPVYSLAFQQNQYPLITSLEINAIDNRDISEDEHKFYRDMKVELTAENNVFSALIWHIDSIKAGHTQLLPKQLPKLSYEYLDKLTEQISINLTFKIFLDDELVKTEIISVDILPKNFWGGEERMAELLAAFSCPNAAYVMEIVKKASEQLKDAGHGSSLDGYQSQTRERPYLMAAAIWNVISAANISYVTPPSSFAYSGQRIRLPDEVQSTGIAACLDLSLLFSACLEHIGLNPIIAVMHGHACCGFWLIDECFPLLTNDDPMDVRKRIAIKDLVLFETTLATSDSPITFGQSSEHAEQLISEDSEEKFVYVIDIAQARKRQIKPIPTIAEQQACSTKVEQPKPLELPVAPTLPPVRAEELPIDDTPEGRVQQWQRKLLDLTKRNRLLNLSANAVAVKIYCPDLGALEDELASGQTFKFTTPAESPLSEGNRDKELFKFNVGDDLQKEFALEQLKSKVLIANDSPKKLERGLLTLFRKAKNDLEEGGSNTLFLAIGMLKWKETPDSERVYQAPLILLPAQLTRASARSKIKIKQLDGEEPIFNSTLIEFLQNDFEIDLSLFKESLPKDDSGVDVEGVWATVRDKVKDVQGFEVKEDLVLSTFSFAKYLMWKDLKDRADVLKENRFVEHLIDTPQKSYHQESHFYQQNDIDSKFKPSEAFIPLNADSSQMVAIAASEQAQDFVLEGPPGTGKSETIANVISHNLAKGRKVLFVAEKMAALNVVYSRLQKIGLSHLCLELHSNKANKKAILDQLKKAWTTRETVSRTEWKENAEKLFELKQHLNLYVNELHKESSLGVSPRQAIARTTKYYETTRFKLNWPLSIETAPISSKSGIESILELAKKLGLNFSDVQHIDRSNLELLKNDSWSNIWQSNFLSACTKLSSALEVTKNDFSKLAEVLGLTELEENNSTLDELEKLTELILEQVNNSTSFIFSSEAKELLEQLEQLTSSKQNLETQLAKCLLSFNIENTPQLPVKSWIEQLKVAESKIWPLKWFAVRKLKKSITENGVGGDISIEQLQELDKVVSIAQGISEISSSFEKDKIWKGWDTPKTDLETHLSYANEIYLQTRKIAGRLDNPVELISKLRQIVVENREFFPTSNLFNVSERFIATLPVYKGAIKELMELGGDITESLTLTRLTESLSLLSTLGPKLKSWCEWVESRKEANEKGLEDLVDALEQGLIGPTETEEQTNNALHIWLAPILIDNSEILRTFKTSRHEDLITQFRELDTLVADTTSEYIASIAASASPDPNSPQAPAEFGVLSRQFNKKSNHMPTRQLITEMGESLLYLTPCFMMSPLSVAQFLPANFSSFDLVVFDEASQITVWDAVGSIARGKNVIIVGDPKQMPPTNFFSKGGSDDSSDEEDLESILDQALSARLPHHRLTGHYRSKHESLIAFSNSHYYENSLVTFPSAETKASAVKMHKIDGLYSKGKNRNNIIEANAVADFIVSNLQKKNQTLTFGIVTLNSEQQRCIEDALDDRRRQHPDIEKFFQGSKKYESIFVKNLESVQGDERDIIILSLGYGPTEPHAKTMSMNFGPLNKQGGERRLNVAITRATTEVHVFSSFDSSMIDLSRTSALAVQHLKYFLEFAEKGPIALPETANADFGVDQFDSYFEEAVAFALRAKGWKVQTQVGVGKFRIDMGIVHPDKPGQFLAGVECDGATYHSSPAARDRDRIRHIILENLGWKLLRIWSTDYFIDPNEIIEKIHCQLTELLAQEQEPINTDEDGDEDLFEQEDESSDTLDPSKYFDEDYKVVLDNLAKEILSEKNGITLHELASDVGYMHDMARTTKKQLDHIESVITPWAGKVTHSAKEKTIWLSPDDCQELIEWRGVDAFGTPREWNSIALPERLGLAKRSLKESPNDPVDFIFNEFRLSRRTKATSEKFQSWIKDYLEPV